jgi:glutamate dehydrogenase (NAD(P)+)
VRTLTDPFALTDDLGPAKVIHVHEPGAGVKGILVVDNVATGPSIGGLRMAPDVSLDECARLARAMTLKNAAAGLPHGGGKSVLFGSPRGDAQAKQRAIRGFAHALRNEADYIFGPDMGTDETCMAWVKDEIGRAVGLPREIGGLPLDELGATAWGLTHAIEVAAKSIGLSLDGARVAIQGYGAVGRHSARFLAERGARIVAASDSRGATGNPGGLDIDALAAAKDAGRGVAEAGGGAAIDPDALVGVDCDIWIPAARPDAIREDNAAALKARLVAPGANIACTAGAEAMLHERGVLCLPDFIVNAGGVICAAMEYAGATETAAFDAIAEKVAANTALTLERSEADGVQPREAASRMAAERVRAAMATRRWNIN